VQDQKVDRNLKGMDDLDFDGWNKVDWDGVFAHHQLMMFLWTGRDRNPRMASRSTLPHAKWRDGAIAEEYIWA
jgi:hypothetical protein